MTYTKKWFKKQKRTILKKMKEREDFIPSYKELEKTLTPDDKKELQKKVDKKFYKQWEWSKYGIWMVDRILAAKKQGCLPESIKKEAEKEKETYLHLSEIINKLREQDPEKWEKITETHKKTEFKEGDGGFILRENISKGYSTQLDDAKIVIKEKQMLYNNPAYSTKYHYLNTSKREDNNVIGYSGVHLSITFLFDEIEEKINEARKFHPHITKFKELDQELPNTIKEIRNPEERLGVLKSLEKEVNDEPTRKKIRLAQACGVQTWQAEKDYNKKIKQEIRELKKKMF